jgi:hypothetical protein
MFSGGFASMAAHATMDKTMKTGVFCTLRVEVLKRDAVRAYSLDGDHVSREHCQDPLPGND